MLSRVARRASSSNPNPNSKPKPNPNPKPKPKPKPKPHFKPNSKQAGTPSIIDTPSAECTASFQTVQGGAIRTYPFDPSVDSVQVP